MPCIFQRGRQHKTRRPTELLRASIEGTTGVLRGTTSTDGRSWVESRVDGLFDVAGLYVVSNIYI